MHTSSWKPSIKLSDLSIGVVGAGAIGSLHINNLQSIGVGKIYAVDPAEMEEELPNVIYRTSVSELNEQDIHAAVVCVPTHLHHVIIKELKKLNSSLPILCEKPLSDDLESTKSLLDNDDTSVQAAFIERFHQPFTEMAAWYDRQAGPIDMSFLRRTYRPVEGHWMLDSELPGSDILLDLGIHDIDLIIRMTQKIPVAITDHVFSVFNEKFTLKFKDGSKAAVSIGWDLDSTHPYGVENVVSLEAENSSIGYTSLDEKLVVDESVTVMSPRFAYAYKEELQHFLSSCTNGEKTKFPTTNELLMTMQCIEMIRKNRR